MKPRIIFDAIMDACSMLQQFATPAYGTTANELWLRVHAMEEHRTTYTIMVLWDTVERSDFARFKTHYHTEFSFDQSVLLKNRFF